MAEMLSPGVYVTERDMSEVVPSVSSTVAVFGGMFTRGPVNDYTLISSVAELEDYYGLPKNDNYNDWYQCYNFLQYGNHLLVSRAGNMNGAPKDTGLKVEDVTAASGYGIDSFGASEYGIGINTEIIVLDKKPNLSIGNIIAFAPDKHTAISQPRYIIVNVLEMLVNSNTVYALVLNKQVDFTIYKDPNNNNVSTYQFDSVPSTIPTTTGNRPYCKIFKITELYNGSCEALEYNLSNFLDADDLTHTIQDSTGQTISDPYLRNVDTIPGLVDSKGEPIRIPLYLRQNITESECQAHRLPNEGNVTSRNTQYLSKSIVDRYELFDTNKHVLNDGEFEFKLKNRSFSFSSPSATNGNKTKLKFISRNPGTDMARYKIAIANPRDFRKNYGVNDEGFITRYVAEGLPVDNIFDYPPEMHTHQLAIVVYDPVLEEVVERFVCSLDPDEVDANNNSMYIENVINRQSTKIFVVVNDSIPLHDLDVIDDLPDVASYLLYDNVVKIIRFTNANDTTKSISIAVSDYKVDAVNNEIDLTIANAASLEGTEYEAWTTCVHEDGVTWDEISNNALLTQGGVYTIPLSDTTSQSASSYTYKTQTLHVFRGRTLTMWNATDSDIQTDDLLDAYNVFSNKDDLDVDIVIANERDDGYSAITLVNSRMDCVAYIGSRYEDCVGQRSATATKSLIGYRKGNGIISGRGVGSVESISNMYCALFGNYKYQYDRYNDTYRWVNFAGDVAGLRAQTSSELDPWWAAAGLNRGQLKNVTKLAFNPNHSQRDDLYKNNINIICTFANQGTVLWGQKTLLDKASSFDRLNVRHLFNHIERALAKMSKYQVFEFNDSFTRNRILSIINPYLSSVQAGRGIQDFYVVCDETNNTPEVISHNQMVVDIYIKPTYVAEFIKLTFINAGTNDFTTVVTGG